MLSIMKNNWNRLMEEKMYVVVAVVLTICSIVLAIVLTGKIKPKLNVAVVGPKDKITASKQIRITDLKKAPAQSSLIEKQYDAIVNVESDGSLKIQSINGEKFNQELEAVLTGKVQ